MRLVRQYLLLEPETCIHFQICVLLTPSPRSGADCHSASVWLTVRARPATAGPVLLRLVTSVASRPPHIGTVGWVTPHCPAGAHICAGWPKLRNHGLKAWACPLPLANNLDGDRLTTIFFFQSDRACVPGDVDFCSFRGCLFESVNTFSVTR